MLSKLNSFPFLPHIRVVIAQKNLACSNWRAAFILHIALLLYGAFGKSFFFFFSNSLDLSFNKTRSDFGFARNRLSGIMTYSLTWLLWNARIFSSFSFIYSLIFSSIYFFFLPTGCQEQPATRLTKASDRHMARPNEASLSLLGSQELRSSVVSVLLSLIPGTPSIAGLLY